jgi:hypothetical protein
MIGFRDNGLESLRSKLRNMTEAELVQFGKTLRDKWDKFFERRPEEKPNRVERSAGGMETTAS